MKTIALLNQKGGVGKTTLAFHLGWYLAEHGHRVLMVDLDPQGNLSTQCGANSSTAQLLFAGGEGGLPALIWTTASRHVGDRDVEVAIVPAFQELQAYEPIAATFKHSRALRTALGPHRDRFDYVVIDCPPSLGGFSTNAMLAADHLIVPTEVRKHSAAGMKRVLQFAQSCKDEGQNPGLRILGVVVMKYNPDAQRQTRFEAGVAGGMMEMGVPVLGAWPHTIKIAEAEYWSLPLWGYWAKQQSERQHDRQTERAARASLALMESIHTKLEGTKLEGRMHDADAA